MKMTRILLTALAWMGAPAGLLADQVFHVAADAPAGGDGSKGAPFSSLTQARDAVRAARKAGSLASGQAVVVRVGPGVYRIASTFKLTGEDGGAEGAPVIYRAERPGETRLQGGISLEASSFQKVTEPAVLSRLDEKVRGQVLAADLTAACPEAFPAFKPAYSGAPAAPWLYVNHEPMTLARWPNADAEPDGWARFSKAIDSGKPDPDSPDPARRKARPGSFEFSDPRPARWNADEGVWLLGYWTHDWSYEVIRMSAYDKERKIISLAAPHGYGIAGGTWGGKERRFFALNTLEELDRPGEWYLDRTRKRLYHYPQTGWPDAEIVLGTLTEPVVRVSGAKHLAFEGLTFEFGHGQGIVVENSEHVEIAGCVVANLAGSGISINGGAKNTIRSCDLFNLGTTGITLSGGDRKSLTPAGNEAVNNHIHHYALFQRTYAPGIGAYGCGQIVRNNRIHDAPHNAVLYSGNEHLFERNEIYRVVMETGDSGAFYSGRDWTSQGNRLRQNYIHDLGAGNPEHVNTMGVYLDDCDSGDTIEGNVFYRAGRAIMMGGGRDNAVLNNLVIDCPIGLHLDSRGMTWKHWNNPESSGWNLEEKAEKLNYKNPPWSEHYPNLAKIMNDSPREPLHNVIRRNVFVDCAKQVCNFDKNVKELIGKLDIAENLAVNTSGAEGIAMAKDLKGFADLSGTESDPVAMGFADESGGDFTLKPDARLLKELPSFQAIPFDKIGLFQDKYRTKIP